MRARFRNQGTIQNNNQRLLHPITIWASKFLNDRRAQGLSPGTYKFYSKKLDYVHDYCQRNNLENIEDLTADHIRNILVELERKGHRPAGVSTVYRTLRTFLYWYEREEEPEAWSNPIRKVKAPKIPTEPLDPVDLEDVRRLLDTCHADYTGDRDRAIFLALLDTGCRATEMCNILLDDVDLSSGSILIRRGKGGKPRTVFVGKRTKRALRQYIKQLPSEFKYLWITRDGDKMTYFTLTEMVRRRSVVAGIKRVGLHAFRRAFALQCLRNGMDIFTLQRLMGHADIQILRRYLAQTDKDIGDGHRGYGPVDNSDW